MTDTRLTATGPAAPVLPSNGGLRPIGMRGSRIEDGYWAHRQQLNAEVMLRHCRSWMERSGWIGNFARAAEGTVVGNRQGREFSDSEVYKLIEAMSWEVGRTGEADLENDLVGLIALVGSAQEADGYLNTNFGRQGQRERYADLQWGHELYNFGHLLQAAVARGRTAGLDDPLVEIARRVADHVVREFGPDGRDGICGHPCIEAGLAEFSRLTGEQRYLDQARLFLERRGHGSLGDVEFGREYYQDDVPVRDATVLRGHAVRALYLSAAAVDVAVETGDADLLAALQAQWAATVARRTYLTGGMGSRHEGEAFGEDWELPPDRAYCETCAGVAAIMFSWRLLLATGESRYADLIERILYNVISTSPAADGGAFFYSNTLHRRVPGEPTEPGRLEARAASALRAPWFEVSCCPPNVGRTLASLSSYVATASADGVQVHQYASGTFEATTDRGRLELRVTTRYPADGRIELEVLAAPAEPVVIGFRVPDWAAGAELVDGDDRRSGLEPGYVETMRDFAAGDRLVLILPVVPAFVYPDERIDDVRGAVAVQRGPEVFCLESVDLPSDVALDDIRVHAETAPEDDGTGGVTLVASAVQASGGAWPYSRARPPVREPRPVEIRLHPYHDWANRGPSTMRIWIPAAHPSGSGDLRS
jgi:DUF1680 family protein